MSAVLERPVGPEELDRRYPRAYLTMINPLRRRRSVSPDVFYAYWRDAHVQIASRLPGIHSLWINWLDYDGGQIWPAVPGVESHLPEEDRFDGVPEPTFLTAADLDRFGGAMAPLMDDEANIFEETIGYRSLGENSRTFVDRLADPAPNGDEDVLRLLVFAQARDRGAIADFRALMVDQFGPVLSADPRVLKLRTHLFEPYENADVFLDARGLSHSKAPEKQYQGCFEIVFADPLELARFVRDDAWASLAAELRRHVRGLHAFQVTRRYCMRWNGDLTLAGLRTAAVAEQIKQLGALNQLDPSVIALLAGG